MIITRAALRRRKLIALSLSVSFLAAPHAYAIDPLVVEGTRHFFDCLGLMLSEPDIHEDECLPNRVVTVPGVTTGSGVSAPIVVPPPPPPPVPEDPCVCGSCYSI